MESLKEGMNKEETIKKVMSIFEELRRPSDRGWDSFVEDLNKFDLLEQ